ncbi:hypothetical protein LguiA_017163 [Lonicera macranthoides]
MIINPECNPIPSYDDGDGESRDQSSDDQNTDHVAFNDSTGYYSVTSSDQFIAMPRPGINWISLEEEPPLQSWATRADEEFVAAIDINNNECCIQLEQDSILHQHFPPLTVTTASPSSPHHYVNDNSSKHIPTSKSLGSEYSPSPIKTRAQRKT